MSATSDFIFIIISQTYVHSNGTIVNRSMHALYTCIINMKFLNFFFQEKNNIHNIKEKTPVAGVIYLEGFNQCQKGVMNLNSKNIPSSFS